MKSLKWQHEKDNNKIKETKRNKRTEKEIKIARSDISK